MKQFIDEQGRLFGVINPIDLGDNPNLNGSRDHSAQSFPPGAT